MEKTMVKNSMSIQTKEKEVRVTLILLVLMTGTKRL